MLDPDEFSYDIFATDSSLARATVVYITGGSDITISGITVKNPPNVFFSQKGGVTNVNYASLTMTAGSKSTNAPKNTDGFDIGESTYTTIKDVIVTNQDDCIAFKPGCNYGKWNCDQAGTFVSVPLHHSDSHFRI